LEDLRTRLTPIGKKELEKLEELKGSHIYIWDYRFYDRLLIEKEYAVDQEKISEYFPLDNTLSRIFDIFGRIFSLRFEEITEGKQVWHEDCRQFAVYEKKDASFVGWLYLDLYPRQGKYSHQANFGLCPGYIKPNGERVYPSTALVCNFSKPTPKQPSLLKHDEVVTTMHEIGHAIHDLVGRTRYSRFHGTNVARDFVEMPSQLLENWCWTEKQIKFLSKHHQTGEALPDDLIRQLIKSKHVNDALFHLRQLFFGLFDITIHSMTENVNSTDLYNSLRRDISLFDDDGETTLGQATFGHLMGGYQSRYYSYEYSLVFAADLWASKFQQDPLSTSTGDVYRHKILEKGSSRDEYDSLRDFLQREPNNDAFLKEIGITQAKL